MIVFRTWICASCSAAVLASWLGRARAAVSIWLGGGAYNRESFAATATQAEFTRNSGEAYFGDDFTYSLSNATSLYQTLRFFPNLSNTGEYRFNFDLGANTKLTRWLLWNIAISDRLLSNPVPGRQKNDLLYTTVSASRFRDSPVPPIRGHKLYRSL